MEMSGFISVNETRGKIIFWDIDGTLAPYRWEGHVGDVECFGEEVCPVIEGGLCLNREPSKHMQKVVMECEAESQYVLGHYVYDKEKSDKVEWLSIHFPEIKDSVFVKTSQSKAKVLLEFCKENGISLEQVLFIDDRIDILKEAEAAGIESWHISSFLDWFE